MLAIMPWCPLSLSFMRLLVTFATPPHMMHHFTSNTTMQSAVQQCDQLESNISVDGMCGGYSSSNATNGTVIPRGHSARL